MDLQRFKFTRTFIANTVFAKFAPKQIRKFATNLQALQKSKHRDCV